MINKTPTSIQPFFFNHLPHGWVWVGGHLYRWPGYSAYKMLLLFQLLVTSLLEGANMQRKDVSGGNEACEQTEIMSPGAYVIISTL